MIKVKVSTNFKWFLERQTPANSGVWGDCRFFVNQDVAECDFWVVFDGLSKSESTKCPRDNTILFTGEPPEVKGYNKRFLAQFGTVITCNRTLEHKNIVIGQSALPWLIGAELNASSIFNGKCMSYEELTQPVTNKSRLLSVVVSSRQVTMGHVKRSAFIERLQNELGTEIDVYGFGRQQVPDKWYAISPYKYHLALENSVNPDYWTEKIADAFLGEAMPIYHGCPNIDDYFSNKSMVCIDINKPDEAIEIIINTIRSDTWQDNRQYILESKQKILTQYNFFNVVDQFIKSKSVSVSVSVSNGISHKEKPYTIIPEQYFTNCILSKLFNRINIL